MKKPGKIYAAVFLPRDNVLSKENRGDKIPFLVSLSASHSVKKLSGVKEDEGKTEKSSSDF